MNKFNIKYIEILENNNRKVYTIASKETTYGHGDSTDYWYITGEDESDVDSYDPKQVYPPVFMKYSDAVKYKNDKYGNSTDHKIVELILK